MAEAAAECGMDAALSMVDLEKFYDPIRIDHLVSMALALQAPARVLLFDVMALLALCAIQYLGAVSQWLNPRVSIVQGSRNSNNLARILLYDVLELAQARIPWVDSNQWVDDIDLLAFGTQRLMEIHSPNATLELLAAIRNEGLRISKIVASRLVLAKRLASLLELEGEHLKVATWILTSREAERTVVFTTTDAHARHGNGFAASASSRHKGPAIKMSTAGFREMCASALTHRAGRCPYTASSIVYDRNNPLIAVCLSQLKTWWEAWVSSENFRQRIQRAWPRIYARILEAPRNRRWRRTHEPIGGITAALADHGWEAPQPDRWTSPTAPRSPCPILRSSPTPTRFSSASRPPFGTTFGWRLTMGFVG